MMTTNRSGRLMIITALAGTAGIAAGPPPARADVTVQQQTSMSLAGINIDMTTVERTSGDKQRRDTDTQCHGFLALFCRNVQSGEIVRLDKQLEWHLEPKKETYTERTFPTPEQRAEAQRQLEAAVEEMKKCPMPQTRNAAQSGPDTSRCQLSPPTLSVNRTNEHATLLGHDTRKTRVLITQSCTDTQTGDVCEMNYGFDSWLTSDDITGSSERTSFQKSYLAAQGLDPNNPQLQGAMQQFMAPYADMLKQLQGKAADLKGHPLRTTFYMSFGGPHCGRAQEAQQQEQQSDSGGSGLGSLASNALRGGLSGLFHRNASSSSSESASSAAVPGQPVQVISLTTETTSIDTSGIPSDQFEIPSGWKLLVPKPSKAREFSCPTAER